MNIKKGLKIKNIEINLLKLIIGIQLLAWVFNLPFTQLQMLFWGRRRITLIHLGIIEFILIILLLVLISKKIYLNKITRYTIAFIGSLIFIGLIEIMINNVEFYWVMYYFFYWIIPFIIILISNQIKFNIDKLNKILLLIIILHCTIIFIQRFTNSIFWPFINDEYGSKLFYISEGYYNTTDKMVRCPGLSVSGLDAGILLIFGCVLLYFIKFKREITKYILGVFFLIGIWFTGTRNIYFIVIYMLIYVLIMKITPCKLRASFCNLYMILSSIIYTFTFLVIGENHLISTKNILTDTLSAKIRIENWNNIIYMIKDSSFLQKIFGQFKWQNNMNNMVIDNIYLELILFCGILGLIIFYVYIIFIQSQLIKLGDKRCNLLIAFISSLMIYGVANVLGNIYLSLIAICILIWNNSMKNEVRKNK